MASRPFRSSIQKQLIMHHVDNNIISIVRGESSTPVHRAECSQGNVKTYLYFLCVMSCHVMSCHVMTCHVMSCHDMTWHVMTCHVMSCHVMSFLSFSTLRWGRCLKSAPTPEHKNTFYHGMALSGQSTQQKRGSWILQNKCQCLLFLLLNQMLALMHKWLLIPEGEIH